MSVGSIGNNLASMLGLDALTEDKKKAQNEKIDPRFSKLYDQSKEAEKALEEITKGGAKGYWNWKIDEMRKKIAGDVMSSMNLTPEQIAAMPPEERLATLNKISEMVEEQLKLAIAEEMKRKQKNTLAAAESMNSVLRNTQDIGLLGAA